MYFIVLILNFSYEIVFCDQASLITTILNEMDDSPMILQETLPYLFNESNVEEKMKLSWVNDEIFYNIMFDERNISFEPYFKMDYDPTLGTCFTFNHMDLNESIRSMYVMENYGLDIMLNLNSDDMLPWIEFGGFYIIIHNRNELFSKDSIMYKAVRNYKNFFYVKTSDQKKLAFPYSNCIDKDKYLGNYYFYGDYTQDGCYRSCYLKYVYEICKCQDPNYLIKKDLGKYCTNDNLDCIINIKETRGDPSFWDECDCPIRCESREYSITYSSAKFPDIMPDCKMFNDPFYSLNTTCRDIFIDKVWIQVTLMDTSSSVILENPKYTFTRILANFGAITGMLIGFSLVTIFEIFLFGINLR
uniref:Ion channel n=1 Tax=Parastrongyloides trichosuri TaxID=131310 RepID=A0A0N5A1B2_PARTI